MLSDQQVGLVRRYATVFHTSRQTCSAARDVEDVVPSVGDGQQRNHCGKRERR